MQFNQSSALHYPLQQAQEDALLACTIYDWPLDNAATQQQLAALRATWVAPMQLNDSLRAAIIKLGPELTLVWVQVHPLQADAASLHLLLREVADLANGAALAAEDDLLPYENYVSWQQDLLGAAEEDALTYWRQYRPYLFRKSLVPYEQPATEARPTIARWQVAAEPAVYQQLQQQSAAQNVPLRILLLSLFARFLYSFERPEQFIIGLQRHHRLYDELKNAVGAMSKTVPLLVSAADLAPGANHPVQLERQEEELMDWEDFFGFAHVGKDKNDGYSYGFGFLPASVFEPMGEAITVTLTDLHAVTEAHDLQLVVREQDQQLGFDFYYASNAYTPQTIGLVADQWRTFLRRKLALSSADQLAQCTSGSAVLAAAIRPQTVVELFREQVAVNPSAVALVYKNLTLSYEQLDATSTQLAHILREQYDVGPGHNVALLLNRSQWLPVSILAVLKAGAAYVPIDPAYPDNRISQIVASGDCQLVLSEAAVWSRKQQLCSLTALLVHDDVLAGAPADPLPLPALTDVAYIIFTSGSTGKPKGVMIQHGSLTNYVQWCNHYYFAPGERGNWALLTSIAFDLTVTAIYASLCRGQVLTISEADKSILSTLEEAFSATGGRAIDVLKLTPSHVAMLKSLPLTSTGVKKVILGGEALEWDHIQTLRQLNPDMEIYNEYGPTEATVGCVVHQVSPQDARIFIGEPIANTTVCVLDEQLECVGNSCIGELYIGGDCLAAGYFHQPELTAQSFVSLPWDPQNRIWYKTGDLVRQNAQGLFDYLGRADKQVKIRGYRIEPGEIQTLLLELPEISNALVGVLKHADESYLIAYLQAETPLEVARVRSHLAERLPAYMLPTEWLQVRAFPLTPNGKVDEKALAHLATEQKQAEERPYVAPATVVEAELQKIWEAVLKQSPISTQESFFALGGNSLNFSQLILRVNQVFGKKVSFSELFDHLTIGQQAAFLLTAQPEAAGQPLRAEPSAQASFPLTPAQYGIWKACQSTESTIAYNMPFVLQFTGELDQAALQGAIAAVVARHESLRTVFRKNADWTVSQHVLPILATSELLTTVDLREENLSREVLEARVLAEIRTPFDLATGPLMRLKLWQLAHQEHVLVYTLHHIIGDGWSMQVLFDELMQAYNAGTAGQPLRLPALPTQYRTYEAWLGTHLTGENGRRLEHYWLSQFDGPVPVLALATDFSRPEQKAYQGKTLTTEINRADCQALDQLTVEQAGTTFMTLLLTTQVLLAKYTGQTDLVIGTPIAGREHLELESQIGLYVNTLALRTQLAGLPTVAALYQRVKQQVVGAYTHQLYPFDTLLQQLNLPLQPGRSPLFDVMVVLQNIDSPQPASQPAGLTVSRFDSDLQSSKYDLCFFFVEEPGAIRVHLEYDTALFREETVRTLLANFRHVASQLAGTTRLVDIHLLTSATEAEENDLFLAQMLEM
ncbi:hypothetical protein GCM10027422_44660 [Hymenobacter arcticus]